MPPENILAEHAVIFAASHGPLIIRKWVSVTPANQQALNGAFAELGRRIRSSRTTYSTPRWHRMILDHGLCIQLLKAGIAPQPAGAALI